MWQDFRVYEYYYFVILIVYYHDSNIVILLLHTIVSHIIDLRVTFRKRKDYVNCS